MDFSVSEEQIELRNLASQILLDQTSNEQLREIEKREDRFDEKLWHDLAEAGLLGIGISETYDGMALGFESLCLLVEQVGLTVAPVPVLPVLVSAAFPLDRFGTDEQRQRLLPGVVRGEVLISAALVEPLNEDPAGPTTTAATKGDHVILNGIKNLRPICQPRGADPALGPARRRSRGLSARPQRRWRDAESPAVDRGGAAVRNHPGRRKNFH